MITVVGIGPGNPDYLLPIGKHYLAKAAIVIGSQRQLQLVQAIVGNETKILPKKLSELANFLHENKGNELVILASGDPLVYGIGTWVGQHFLSDEYRIVPGISAIQYFFSRLGMDMNDCYITSSHGRHPNMEVIASLPKTALVTDDKFGPYELAQALANSGNKRIYIGECLSTAAEQIRSFAASEVPDEDYKMNVVVIVDEG